MDADSARRQPVRLVTLLEGWRERQGAQRQALQKAAEEWGVRREHPEAKFVDALVVHHSDLGELLAAFAGDMEIIVGEARQSAEAEFARQHRAVDETRFQLTQARGAIRDLDVEKGTDGRRDAEGRHPKARQGR